MTELSAFWQETGLPSFVQATPLSGGCINEAWKVISSDGTSYFVKSLSQAPAAFFECEAAGLKAIKATHSVRCPEVVCCLSTGLVLEFIETSAPTQQSWYKFGCQLAKMHRNQDSNFGFDTDNFCGLTPQCNTWRSDGYVFFAENRLLALATTAYERALMKPWHLRQIEKLIHRLPELIPSQPASLIHGDLWSGNVLFDAQSQPVLIDPAVHYGWREAELAMTTLFGSFPEAFYQGYQEVTPNVSGWRRRAELYNLYHLLNHLLLFGESYLPQIETTLKRYL